MKPLLYIDVDDTIIAHTLEGAGYNLRPNVMTQLDVLSRLFVCRWLTYWPAADITSLMRHLYGTRINANFLHADWLASGDSKAEFVLKGKPEWFWLENPLTDKDTLLLTAAGQTGRYIEVAPVGPGGFANGCLELFRRAGIKTARLSAVGAKLEWFTPPV